MGKPIKGTRHVISESRHAKRSPSFREGISQRSESE